jgi:hypothetical protein
MIIIQNENIQGFEKLWIPLIFNTCYGPLTQERLGQDFLNLTGLNFEFNFFYDTTLSGH